jgi:metal-responsive CopG/Arc/MetJ family transcriptional regulator
MFIPLIHSNKSVIGVHMKKLRGKVTIKIPRPLYENLSKIIKESGFNSVTEFIVYILRDLISSRSVKKEASLSNEEIEMIKKRLKSLGYF